MSGISTGGARSTCSVPSLFCQASQAGDRPKSTGFSVASTCSDLASDLEHIGMSRDSQAGMQYAAPAGNALWTAAGEDHANAQGLWTRKLDQRAQGPLDAGGVEPPVRARGLGAGLSPDRRSRVPP